MRKESPNLHNAKISVQLGERWNALSAAEQQPFRNESRRLRESHSILHPDYKYRPRKKSGVESQIMEQIKNHKNYFEVKKPSTKPSKPSKKKKKLPVVTQLRCKPDSPPGDCSENWYDNFDYEGSESGVSSADSGCCVFDEGLQLDMPSPTISLHESWANHCSITNGHVVTSTQKQSLNRSVGAHNSSQGLGKVNATDIGDGEYYIDVDRDRDFSIVGNTHLNFDLNAPVLRDILGKDFGSEYAFSSL